MNLKKYIALFRDEKGHVLHEHRFFAFDIQAARAHAKNMLAASKQGDVKKVAVYRIYP